MKVELLQSTNLMVVSRAIRTCWDSHDKSDSIRKGQPMLHAGMKEYGELPADKDYIGEKDRELIDRVGNKMKHSSVLNHCSFTFDIQGISTKTLLALTRHDIGTEFSVQSTRYTVSKMLKNEEPFYSSDKERASKFITLTDNDRVDEVLIAQLEMSRRLIIEGGKIANDDIAMTLSQAYKYNLVATFSLQALQHFIELRTDKSAHYDIQELAHNIIKAIPKEYHYLIDQFNKGNESENIR